jgi:uncharacterized metal-binding protein
MRFALTILNGRIAPRPTSASSLVLVDRESASRTFEQVKLDEPSLTDLLIVMKGHEVDFLVCCGIDRSSKRDLNRNGIRIIENVACSESEAVDAIFADRLHSGYGLVREETATGTAPPAESVGTGDEAPEGVESVPRCLVFAGKSCAGGRNCPLAYLARVNDPSSWTRPMLDAAMDVALEKERNLCRLSEVIYFCLEMKYRTIGLAFCSELEEPARIAASVLRRFFDVVGVCCKVVPEEAATGGNISPAAPAEAEAPRPCNPLGQAQVLNRTGCDLVIAVGLCVGADCVLGKACEAPVTTLFVKDKVLANNPIGAVYSKRYLKETLHALSST